MRPFLRTANILWGKIDVSVLDYMHFEETEEQKLTLQYGDLLVCEGGDIGRTAIWRDQIKPCYYQNHLHRLRSTLPDIIPIFYMYWMELAFTISRLYGGVGNKTTIPNLSQSRLSSFYIPLPPLSEQKAIAAVLSAIQEAKEKTEAVISATKELKKSMMKHLFTYGPVSPKEKDKVELKQTELGPLPKEWEVVRLGDIFSIQQGKSVSPKSRFGLRMRPFLRTANILWGKIDVSVLDYMHFEETEEQKLTLQYGDLLVCEGGDIGRTAIWRDQIKPCYYQNHLHRLRSTRPDIVPIFYMYWMELAFTISRLYGGVGNKTTIPNLSQSRLLSFYIPLPPLPIQQKIASILSAIDAKIEAEVNKKKALEALFKSMLHHLMTGKVRVKDWRLGDL